MSDPIGYQDGITGFIAWLRKQPGVQARGPGYDKADLSTWPWPDKLERTLRILKDEHDAADPSDPPDDPPPPLPGLVAPRTYNGLPGGEPSARFCVKDLPRNADGRRVDMYATYDDDGRDLGGRTNMQVAGLKPANQMDGRDPCELYNGMTRWPADSYLR